MRLGIVRFSMAVAAMFILFSTFANQARAQSPIPLETVKQALRATAGSWIALRNYDGRQWLYFTQILSWKCGLKEIRYAINSSHLSDKWPIPPCDPQNPYFLDPTKAAVFISYELDSVRFVSVQLVFNDDTTTQVRTYTPCDADNEASCAVLLD